MTKTKLPPIHPGEILLEEFLKPMEISEIELATEINVPLQIELSKKLTGELNASHSNNQ